MKLILAVAFLLLVPLSGAQAQERPWGDLGNGRYANPLGAADFNWFRYVFE